MQYQNLSFKSLQLPQKLCKLNQTFILKIILLRFKTKQNVYFQIHWY